MSFLSFSKLLLKSIFDAASVFHKISEISLKIGEGIIETHHQLEKLHHQWRLQRLLSRTRKMR